MPIATCFRTLPQHGIKSIDLALTCREGSSVEVGDGVPPSDKGQMGEAMVSSQAVPWRFTFVLV